MYIIFVAIEVKGQNIDLLKKKQSEGILSDSERVTLFLYLGNEANNNDNKEAYYYGSSALSIAGSLKSVKGQMHAQNILGIYYYKRSNYDSSLFFLEQSLTNSILEKDLLFEARVRNQLALNYYDMGQYSIALDYYMKALDPLRKAGMMENVAHIYSNLGLIYSEFHQYEKAMDFHNRSLAINKSTDDNFDAIALNYIEIADVYVKAGQYNEASIYLDSVMDMKARIKSPYTHAYYSFYRGEINAQQKFHQQAIHYYIDAVKLLDSLEDEKSESHARIKLGASFLASKNPDKALEVLTDANQAAYRLKLYDLVAESEFLIAQIYEMRMDFKEAFTHLKLHKAYTDSVNNAERSRLLTESQVRFATREKDYENESLRKEQAIKDREITNQKRFLAVVISASVLLLLAAIYEFIQYRKKQKLNLELLRLNQDILSQKNEIEIQAIELEKLTREIEEKNKLLEKDNYNKSLSIEDKQKRIMDFAFFNAHELRACIARILGLVNVFKHSYHSKQDLETIVAMVEKSTLDLDVIVRDFGKRLINLEDHDNDDNDGF